MTLKDRLDVALLRLSDKFPLFFEATKYTLICACVAFFAILSTYGVFCLSLWIPDGLRGIVAWTMIGLSVLASVLIIEKIGEKFGYNRA